MIDLQDNDATHGDETYSDRYTTEAFIDAREQIFNSLISGDEDIKAIAIDTLIQDENFWNAVFNICADETINCQRKIKAQDFAEIRVAVFASVCSEIGKLAEELS